MALLNRPLTAAEVKAIASTPLAAHLRNIELFVPSETYDTVEYEARRNRTGTTTARAFFVRCTSSPSDCTMMMPGSFRARR